MAPPYNDSVINSIPISENLFQTSHQSDMALCSLQVYQKESAKDGEVNQAFSAQVDIEGMNDINDVSIIHKWMKWIFFLKKKNRVKKNWSK